MTVVKTGKKYTAEEKKEYYQKQKQDIEEMLIKGVEQVYTSENFTKYLDTLRKFHSYSAMNCLLIVMQMPDASLVAGFNDWKKKFKRSVKKGEKAIRIIAPIPCKYTVKETLKDGTEEEREVTFQRFKTVPVFDISQTDGEDLPKLCQPLTADVSGYEEIIDKLVDFAQYPVIFEHIDTGAHGYFDVKEQKIVINDEESQAQTIKTLVHEIAHSILHNDAFCEIPKEIKEIQAESTAYMVCSEIGLDTSGYSFEYVARWAQMDMKKLRDQMDIVRKTADAIIEKLK